METCPLCLGADAKAFFTDEKHGGREFFSCPGCGLVFVPARFHPSPEDEKRRYDLHRNDPGDAGYRDYLNQLAAPLCARLRPGSRGLDFGSGPGPALAAMMEAAGHPTRIYDPFYAPDLSALEEIYDFVAATEVVEHLRDPRGTLERMWSLVRPGGWLGLLTQSPPPAEAFGRWTYKNDPTHLVFYPKAVFGRLAGAWGAEVEFDGRDAILLRKV